MSQGDRAELVVAIARDVVAESAPEEIPVFPGVSAAYLKNPAGVTGNRPVRESPLAFGADASVFLTPVALAVTHRAVLFLLEEVQKGAKDAASAVIREQAASLLKRFHSGADPAAPKLTGEQLARVRQIAIMEARRLNLPNARAELLADALVGRLAVNAPR